MSHFMTSRQQRLSHQGKPAQLRAPVSDLKGTLLSWTPFVLASLFSHIDHSHHW